MSVKNKQVVAVINLPKTEGQQADVLDKKKQKSSSARQLVACTLVQSILLFMGTAMGYSSALIPQLEADDSDLPLTRDQSAWIASVYTLAGPLGFMVGVWMINAVGRLRSIQVLSIPLSISWMIMANAHSFEELILGRMVMGACMGTSFSAAMLYTAEVAQKHLRGVLSCVGTSISTIGIVLTYVVGAYVPWRASAWGFSALPLLLLCALIAFPSESPVWLREHGKYSAARKASMHFYNDPEKVLSSAKEGKDISKTSIWKKLWFLCSKPAGYKPFIMMAGLFLLLQLTGTYILIYYAVTFFQESGSDMDPYYVTIIIGVLRVVFTTGSALGAGSLGRRPVLIISALGMGVSMIGSGFATQQILNAQEVGDVPEEWLSYAVVVCILLYVAFCSFGIMLLPLSMTAEVFPHEVRDVAQPINTAVFAISMFTVLQLYPTLTSVLGGSVGLQFLFAGSSLVVAVYVWAFVVETRGLSLEEIEDYFAENVFYPGHKSRQQNSGASGAR